MVFSVVWTIERLSFGSGLLQRFVWTMGLPGAHRQLTGTALGMVVGSFNSGDRQPAMEASSSKMADPRIPGMWPADDVLYLWRSGHSVAPQRQRMRSAISFPNRQADGFPCRSMPAAWNGFDDHQSQAKDAARGDNGLA